MATIRLNLKGLTNLKKDLPAFSQRMLKEVADASPRNIIANIFRRKTGIFPAANLPFNKASTIRRKGHNRQLIDKGDLTTISKWSIAKAPGGYLVKPPETRREVVAFLNEPTENRPAYKIFEIPEGFFPGWAKKLIEKAFLTFVKQYT